MDYDKYNKIHTEASTIQLKHGGGLNAVIEREKKMREICMKHGSTVMEYRSHRKVYAHGGYLADNSYRHQLHEIIKGGHIHDWLKNPKVQTSRKKAVKYAEGGIAEAQNKLSKVFKLPYELAVYVPSTKGVSKEIPPQQFRKRIEEVERYLSSTFGGFSEVDVQGGYIANDNELVREKIGKVTAFCGIEDFEQKFKNLLNQIVTWCKDWTQEAIGFEFEGDLHYIDSQQVFERGGQASRKNYIAWKMHEVMSEFKRGKLRSSSGDKVTDRKQAIAIGLSVANRGWEKKSKRK